jgi:putative ABC transport system permease protein
LNSYTFHITLYDLAFLGAIFIGLTFALLLWFTKTINRSANRFLALALATMILWMLRTLAIDISLNIYLPHWDWLSMQFLLALGPLLYFYVLKTTSPQFRFRWKDMLHFYPLFLEQGVLVLEIRESARTGAATYATQIFHILNPVLELLIFISIIIYLYRSYKLILRFYTRQPIVMMDRSRLEFRWLRRLLAATAFLWFLWIAFAAVDYFGYRNQSGIHVYYPFYIFFAVMMIWFAAAAFLRPQAAVTAQTAASAKPPISAELREKGTRLKKAMETHLYYQDPEINLSSLAEKLKLHPHELSRIINIALKKNFNDFINEYRIRDVVSKMQDSAYNGLTMVGIAFEAGFNSKSTFNRVFREMTGKSPAEFKNNLQKDSPTYHLRLRSRSAAVISNYQAPKWADVKLNRHFMFRNYVKIAWRNLIKNKLYSALNVLGLATGLGVCLLIILYVTDELSYDRYNVNAGRIYRIDEDTYINNTRFDAVNVSKFLGPTLVASYPKIQQMVRFRNPGNQLVRKGGNYILEHHFVFADSTIFKVFTLPMIAGDPNTALNNPHSIVIDESAALRNFNSTDVIGRTLEVSSRNIPLKITGVIRDMPEQSQFHFSFIRPISESPNFNSPDDNNWLSSNYYTYVLVQPGTTPAEVQQDVDEAVNLNIGPALQQMVHASVADLEKSGNHFRYRIFPLTNVHLHSNKSYELEANSNIQFVYIFSIIAVLILLIACVNFMNLSTARSANRAKEVGIRKVAGSTKGNLIIQFLTESVLLSLFSLVLALGIAALLLPVFNQLAGKSLHPGVLFGGRFLLFLVLLVLLVGCLAGSYPAFYLSSFRPIDVLKGKTAAGFKSSWLRSGLVVFQFFISIGLIISTLVIYRQLHFIQNKDAGFNRDQVLVIHDTWALGRDGTTNLRTNLLTLAGVTDATITGDLPTVGGDQYRQPGWFRDASLDAKKAFFLTTLMVDDHYIPTLRMQVVKGRNFNPAKFPTDSTGIVLNEAAVAMLGVKDPLNQVIWYKDHEFPAQAFHVVGVVKDFNYNSMHDNIHPLVMQISPYWGNMAVRFHTNDVSGLVRQVESKFHAIKRGLPFSYTFMDDDFDKLYHAEQQTGQIFITFAVLAILIACLGLFGLVTYAAEQRTKEIGIRKVLGASVSGIVSLLSRDFTMLVGIAALIAFPVAWWAMYKWLNTFAYRTQISWWIFLVAGVIALAIALLTVSIQTIRAALANPVKSLRSE